MKYVKKEIKNNIAYITIDRPPVNALVPEVYINLIEAFASINDDLAEVRCVIFTGTGQQFIVGNDVNDFTETKKSKLTVRNTYFNTCLSMIYNCPVPVIGAVNGSAVGAGFCIASVCDILVAAKNARFGLPELKIGVLGGLAFLPAMVPPKMGRYMSLTGNLISAEKLESFGSVLSVVPREKLIEEAERVAEEIKTCPPLAVQAWKKSFLYIDRLDFNNIEQITDMFILDLLQTEDSQEAVQAFLEKRTPKYKGK